MEGPFIVAAILSLATVRAIRNKSRAMVIDLMDYTIPETILLHTIFPHAQSVTARVRRHVLGRPEDVEQAWVIKESYTTNFNIVAVAGAIVAQIAITALSLPYVEQTHWTVGASFTVSLTAGLLSVYFACMVQVQLGGLHSSGEVRRWLITERTARVHLLRSLARKHREHLEAQAKSMQSRLKLLLQADASGELATLMLELHTQHIPSFYSALLLVAPLQLLNWSLVSLLVGVGIYYGLVFTNALGETRGAHANLALLLVYTVFTSIALASFVMPSLLKLSETSDWAKQNSDRLEELLHHSPNLINRHDGLVSSPGIHHSLKPSSQHVPIGPANPSAPPPSDAGGVAQKSSSKRHDTTGDKDGADVSTEADATMEAGGRGRLVKSVNLTRGRVLQRNEANLSSLEGALRTTKAFCIRVLGL